MRSHLYQQVNHKVSHFITREEGKVGSQSAFTAAAFIGATSLAGMLLSASNAVAGPENCGGGAICNDFDRFCCHCWDPDLNEGIHDCGPKGDYKCESEDMTSPGLACWNVMDF